MKVAEALMERADANQRLHNIESRLNGSIKTAVGQKPSEAASDLIVAYQQGLAALYNLMVQIDTTNSATTLDFEGQKYTVSEALVRRAEMNARAEFYQRIAQQSRVNLDHGYGYSAQSPTRYQSHVDGLHYQGMYEEEKKRARALDIAIQHANWTNDLI